MGELTENTHDLRARQAEEKCCPFQDDKHPSLDHTHTHERDSHKQRPCVCVRVIPGKASSRRARQCTLGKLQSKLLCGVVGSPATARPLPDRLHQPTPPKSVYVDFKNGRTQSPPARAQNKKCRQTRRSFCATARIFRTLLRRAATEKRS